MALKKKKDIEILWKKKFWNKLIDQMPPSKQILVKKWYVFREFVIFIKFDSDNDSKVKIEPDFELINEKSK